MKEDFDISKHILVPKHVKLSKKETEALLEHYKITLSELPRMSATDPGLAKLEVEIGDVIKIIRPSPTAGEPVFYRRVTK